MTTSAADLKKWVQARRLAEARERAAQTDAAPDPAMALERGFALIAFAAELNLSRPSGTTLTDDDLAAYRRWARVRSALRAA